MENLKPIKSALITGASRGLGRALALRLARDGTGLALVARGKGELDRVVAEARALGGASLPVVAIASDVADKRAIHGLVARACERLGPIDLLIHNASVLGAVPLRLWLDTECEDFEAALAANVVGPARLTRLVAGSMCLRGRGLVVSISSDAAVAAYPRWGAYGASKAALDHLTRTLAAELEGTGVAAISIDPGEMNTEMHRQAVPEADPRTLADPAHVAENIRSIIREAAAGRIPTGSRIVTADWVANRRLG